MNDKRPHEELKAYVKQLEQEIVLQKRFQNINQVMFKISKAIGMTSSLEELYETIHRALSTIIDTTNFFIAMYDKSKDRVTFPYCIDSANQCYPTVSEISNTASLTAKVIITGRPLLIKKEERIRESGKTDKIIPSCTVSEVWLGVPLKSQYGIIGVMAVQSYTDADRYDQTDMDVMLSVADMVGLAIERKQSEDALIQSEKKLKLILDSLTDMVLEVDTEMTIIWANKTALNLNQGAIGQSCYKAFPGRESICDGCYCLKAFKTGNIEMGVMYQAASKTAGESYWENIGIPLKDINGKVSTIIEVSRDVTERMHFETEKNNLISELQTTLKRVKKLSGLLPICSHCKKIRDDKGYWNQVESYISKYSDVEFSHGICRECAKKYYPDFEIYED